jgi:hypothetical protein
MWSVLLILSCYVDVVCVANRFSVQYCVIVLFVVLLCLLSNIVCLWIVHY